jgi:hypothetical protein
VQTRDLFYQEDSGTWLDRAVTVPQHSNLTNMEESRKAFRRLLLPHLQTLNDLTQCNASGLPASGAWRR